MRAQKFTFVSGLLLNLVLLSGCATAVRGTHENVVVASVPEGATVVADQKSKADANVFASCSPTPCAINLSRKKNALLTVSKDGHAPISFEIVSGIASSKSSIGEGALLAGSKDGSYVEAGVQKSKMSGRTLSFMSSGGLLSVLVDSQSGAIRSLSPNVVTATLAPGDKIVEHIEARSEPES